MLVIIIRIEVRHQVHVVPPNVSRYFYNIIEIRNMYRQKGDMVKI